MLGKLEEKVKRFLLALGRKRSVLNTVVAIAAAKALIQKRNEEHLKLIKLKKSAWTDESSTTRRLAIPHRAQKESALIFHHEIGSKIEKYQIPHLLVLNIDQTLSKMTPTSGYTLAGKNSKYVSIAGLSYKQAMTIIFGITFSNGFLPMQLINRGNNQKISKVQFLQIFQIKRKSEAFQ